MVTLDEKFIVDPPSPCPLPRGRGQGEGWSAATDVTAKRVLEIGNRFVLSFALAIGGDVRDADSETALLGIGDQFDRDRGVRAIRTKGFYHNTRIAAALSPAGDSERSTQHLKKRLRV